MNVNALPTSRYCGIDLGGTSAKLVIADADGAILSRESFSTGQDGTPSAVVSNLLRCINQMQEATGSGELLGVGIGAPGLVEIESGVIKFFPNLPTQWRDVPLAATMAESLGCPVRVLNDVRTATLGELQFGCGRGEPGLSMAFFSIGTGIGGGIVVDGNLRLGPLGAAGELGHQIILPDGPACGCGGRGCLETVASGPAIAAEGIRLMRIGTAPALRELTGGDERQVSVEAMGRVADSDPMIGDAIERAAVYLGLAAANVVAILHPDRVVLGGGVSLLGERLLEPVRRTISDRVGMFPTDGVVVECSRLGSDAGLLGAVALARQAVRLSG